MKTGIRRIAATLIAIGMVHVGMSQSKKGDYELGAGYGALTIPQIEDFTSSTLLYSVMLGTYDPNTTSYSGSLNVKGRYFIKDRIGVGAAVAYEQIKQEPLSRWGGNPQKLGEMKISYYSIMPSATFIYSNRRVVQLYSEVSLGAGIKTEKFWAEKNSTGHDESHTTAYFAYQLTPFGIRVGRKFAGFAEVGIGYRGCLNAGVSYRF